MKLPVLACAALAIAALLVASPALAGDLVVDGSFVSTAATGTPPLVVSSTTKVGNLNADRLDGLDSTDLFTAATDGSGSGLDADLLDGLDAAAFARSLGNVVLVAKTGGDYASIQAALDSITTASSSNPFLVVVGPGVYSERVVMKPFVDVQGSGEGVTKITQSGSFDPDFGTVAGADDAELRFLTVENTGGTFGVIGVYNSGVSPRLTHVTVRVDGTANTSYGVFNEGATGVPTAVEMRDVTVVVDGTDGVVGVLNQTEADTRMEDVRVTTTGSGVNSKYGVRNSDAAPTLLDVEVSSSSSGTTASVFGIFNQNAPSAVLRSVRVEVAGGALRWGVDNTSSSLTIRGLEVRSAGAADTVIGVLNENGSVVLEDCSIEISGGTMANHGVFFSDASGEIRDCTVIAEDGAGTDHALSGFDSDAGDGVGFAVDIQHSRLRGGEAALTGAVLVHDPGRREPARRRIAAERHLHLCRRLRRELRRARHVL